MPSLLVIDDEESLRSVISDLFTEERYDVTAADSAEDALVLIAQHAPDIILCDLRLPHMDGFAFVHALRAIPGCMKIPVILMTGSDAGEVKEMTRDQQIAAVITKPFDIFELLRITRSLLNERTSQ